MTAAAILERLALAGVTVREDEGLLLAGPAKRVTDELRALIQANKPELVVEIQDRRPPFIRDVLRLFPGSRIEA